MNVMLSPDFKMLTSRMFDVTACPPPPKTDRPYIPTHMEAKVSSISVPLVTLGRQCTNSGSPSPRLKPRPTFAEAPFKNLPRATFIKGKDIVKRTSIDDIIANAYIQMGDHRSDA